MEEVFIKKFWDEEGIMFYVHFLDGLAMRQIEVSSIGTRFLSRENWKRGDSTLYDKTLDELELEGDEFISKAEFESVWSSKTGDEA